MSQYTNFFLKGDDKFYSLGDWSRGSAVARIANPHLDNKYDVAKFCSHYLLSCMEDEARGAAAAAQESIEKYQEKVNMVSKFENSVEEKLNAILEYEDFIKEAKEDKESFEYACHYFSFLMELENEIYAGIECGEQPGEIIE